MSLSLDNGILVDDKFRIDPSSLDGSCFVSHGHLDHVPRQGAGEVFCSDETFKVMSLRRRKFNRRDVWEGAELLNAGHVFGSRMLLYDGLLYTGDFCTRDRFFLKGAKPVKAETLIIESTFGSPEYEFPSMTEIIKRVKEWIDENPKTIWFGYPFGKAQNLTALANNLGIVPYVAGAVKDYNELVPSLEFHELNESVLEGDEFTIIAPNHLKKAFPTEVMRAMGISSAYFSGWAVKWNRLRTDRCFPLSDHCDFRELVDFVKRVDPERVRVVHGDGDEFINKLTELGFDACRLGEESLNSFIR